MRENPEDKDTGILADIKRVEGQLKLAKMQVSSLEQDLKRLVGLSKEVLVRRCDCGKDVSVPRANGRSNPVRCQTLGCFRYWFAAGDGTTGGNDRESELLFRDKLHRFFLAYGEFLKTPQGELTTVNWALPSAVGLADMHTLYREMLAIQAGERGFDPKGDKRCQ